MLAADEGFDAATESDVWRLRAETSDASSLVDTEIVRKTRFGEDFSRCNIEMGIGRVLGRALKKKNGGKEVCARGGERERERERELIHCALHLPLSLSVSL